MSSACSSLRMRFSTRCLATGSTGVSVTTRTKFLKSFLLSRVSKLCFFFNFFTFLIFASSGPGWGYDWWKYQYGWHPPLWVITRSRRRNVMNHIATIGGPYLVVEGAGNCFTMIHTATRASSWPYMDFFWWRQFWGVGYARIWHMGGAYRYMGAPQRHRFLGWLKCVSPYYWRHPKQNVGGLSDNTKVTKIQHLTFNFN